MQRTVQADNLTHLDKKVEDRFKLVMDKKADQKATVGPKDELQTVGERKIEVGSAGA